MRKWFLSHSSHLKSLRTNRQSWRELSFKINNSVSVSWATHDVFTVNCAMMFIYCCDVLSLCCYNSTQLTSKWNEFEIWRFETERDSSVHSPVPSQKLMLSPTYKIISHYISSHAAGCVREVGRRVWLMMLSSSAKSGLRLILNEKSDDNCIEIWN